MLIITRAIKMEEFNVIYPFVKIISSKKEDADRLLGESLLFFRSLKAAGSAGSIEESDFRLVMDEAVENAVTHGNRRDPEKKVMVIVKGSGRKIYIIVKDNGSGFVPEDILGGIRGRDPYEVRGRGLQLMFSIGSVRWNAAGNCVRIELE